MNRSYSISSSPTEREYVDLTIKREPRGAVSRHIVDLLKVGDLIEAGGPVGKFTFDGTEAESIVLISAGVGITPMVSITRYLTERSWPGDIFFIYTCRTPADFIFADEVAALQQRNPKLHVAVTSTKAEGTDWKGPRGRLTKELLTQTVPDLASRRIHICGPPTMMEATKALLTELGVPPEQVKSELFGATKPSPARRRDHRQTERRRDWSAGHVFQEQQVGEDPRGTDRSRTLRGTRHRNRELLPRRHLRGVQGEDDFRRGRRWRSRTRSMLTTRPTASFSPARRSREATSRWRLSR